MTIEPTALSDARCKRTDDFHSVIFSCEQTALSWHDAESWEQVE